MSIRLAGEDGKRFHDLLEACEAAAAAHKAKLDTHEPPDATLNELSGAAWRAEGKLGDWCATHGRALFATLEEADLIAGALRALLQLYDWRNEVGSAITPKEAVTYGQAKKIAWETARALLERP